MTEAPSLFEDVELAPAVPVFKLTADWRQDPDEKKINLGVGAYRDENGQPWVLPVVRSIEAQMAIDPLLTHEYLPILGLPDFRTAAVKLLLGNDSSAIIENRAAGIQCLSGTGALCIGAEFLKKYYNKREANTPVYVSDPTWGNHYGIFRKAGFNDIRKYRYWNEDTKALHMSGLVEDLMNAPEFSIIVLHSCAHNPTGVDPNIEQWKKISEICKQRNLFPFFDCAYQGFASGDPDNDAWSVRYFAEQGFELFASSSYSKNFGLYNERAGNLTIVLRNPSVVSRALTQIELIIRVMYSNPPNHGARIVSTALNNLAFRQEWNENIKTMSGRIKEMRQALFSKLRTKGVPGNWDHVINQIGMFCYTGLSSDQVQFLRKRHIYLMGSGRINICSLNYNNIDYFVDCVAESFCQCTVEKEGKL